MSKTIALYGGGFKPPTLGHFEVVKQALKQNPDIDEFIIYVGAKERNGITQAQSIIIWEIYQTYLPMKVRIEPSKSPIGDIMRFAKENTEDTIYFVIGSRKGNEGDEQDYQKRTKNVETKYPNIKIKLITTPLKDISGSKARNSTKQSPEEFYKYLPSELTDEEKEEVYNIVKPAVKESLNESFYLDIPKFNQPKIIQQYLIENINKISLSKENAVDINGDLTGGTFTVGDITYGYNIKNIPNPYKDLGLFYNIQFTPKGEVTPIPKGGKENYIKILSTMYKIIVDFIEKEQPEYVGISSLDNSGDKNYHTVYNRLTTNNLNLIPGYFRKDSNLQFDSPQGKGRFIVLKRKESLNENASYSQDIDIKQRIMQLTQHMLDKGMNIEPLPNVEFVDGDKVNAREFLGKTAYYDPNSATIVLYTEGRHPKDIVRSFSHEMVHHEQNLDGRLGDIYTTNTQEDDRLNDIEKEANLNGTMTFRNWTDSLNEAIVGDKIECDDCGWSWKIADGGDDLFVCHKCGHDNSPLNEVKPYKHKHGFDDKLGKDPFGLSAYARELALGLEEEIEEGRKKKKDPKKGTGKKPKGSGRRLYTDEDPKDTVGIKFSTRQDIVDTLNKTSFKNKSHARQSQIINLIHQRVRAAYGRAKDPDVKKRLKSGLDYITKKKEASKKKTQRLKKQKTNENLGTETKPKMSFEDRLSYYKDYYINVSPSTFDIITEDGTIVIGGLDKPYPKDFNGVKDIRQVPVPLNENVPDAKDDGKAAPYGSGYEKLNEGKYDTLVNKLSSIAFKAFKDIHDKGDKKGEFEFRVDHPDDKHDIPSEDFYFDFVGKVEITDDEYGVDGGANAGFDNEDEEITPLLSVKFKIPQNPNWQKVSFDIKDVVRHELEHLTQEGENEKTGKYMEDDQMFRDLIDLNLLPKSDYFKLEKEVDAMLQGLYFKAKKSKRPFKDVIDDYLNIFIDQETITQEEKENILDIWRTRAKSLSLPFNTN